MAVPTSITDCNATAANNSPAGSDSIGTSLDDYLRAHAAIIRQAYDALVVVDGTLLPKAGGSVTGTITTTHQIKGITPVANEDLTRKDYVDSMLSGNNVSSGTYTPSFSNYSNVYSTGILGVWNYIRVGNIVTVTGQLTITPTSASTLTSFYITLPFASAFSSAYQVSGHIDASNSGGTSYGTVVSDAAADYALASYNQVGNTFAMDIVVSFMYQVI